MITSLQNPRVKYLKALLHKKFRQQENRFMIEGENLVGEAVNSAVLECFYYTDESPLVLSLKKKGIPGWLVSPRILSAVAATEEPQGIVGVASIKSCSLASILKAEKLLLVVADRIQDPGNVGVMIRTASAVGAAAVLLSAGSADPYNPKSLRSSAGAIFHLPVVVMRETEDIINCLKEKGLKIYAADQKATRNYREIRYNERAAFVFGSEGQGLKVAVRAQCDERVAVPIFSNLDSLNVAVSAGIILYEVAAQRQKEND